jgi:outer membrane protein assembly factor BamE (lipoprotein component of BamABCDE complex)
MKHAETLFSRCRQLILPVAIMLLMTTGCVVSNSEKGVDNLWRDKDTPEFIRGETTQSEVLEALGPPSQIIALEKEVVFYYLRELEKSKGAILILYNLTNDAITYDRAIFFFDKKGILKDYALSQEKIGE